MIVAIVQARMGSSRLPGKVMADVAGVPLINRVIDRTKQSTLIEKVVVATTVEPADDVLEAHLNCSGVPVFRGSETDVLARYYECATRFGATIIVRITADDPLKDPSVIDRVIGELLSDQALDYCSNTLQPTFPEGLDVEVVRIDALRRAYHEAVLPSEREHVTPFIWKHAELFKIRNVSYKEDLSSWRLTVDHPADLELARRIYEHFADVGNRFGLEDLISFLRERPDLRCANLGPVRNEGYSKSIRKENEH